MMMKNPYFSVIIPIYNVEAYLRQCVDSVLAQTFHNIEVILVDDGSPDNCPAICDEYARQDPRIKVIHKENGGLSDARNFGIRAAEGEYLLFLDSDDYWGDPEALEVIHRRIGEYEEPADMLMFQAQLIYPDGTVIPDKNGFPDHFNDMTREESLVYMVENGLLIGSACSKVVKRSFLLENDLFFKVGIKSEDVHWIFRVASAMPKYQYTDQYFYMYRKGRPGSITTTVTFSHLCQLADMLEEFGVEGRYHNDTAKRCVLGLVAYQLTILMAYVSNLTDGDQRNQLIRRIKGLKHLLAYDLHPRVKLVNKVRRFAGLDLTIALLGAYLKYRKR